MVAIVSATHFISLDSIKIIKMQFNAKIVTGLSAVKKPLEIILVPNEPASLSRDVTR